MGELIELTTWPKHQNVFYEMSSSAISFEVKGPGNASIGLVKQPGKKYDLRVVLGHNRNSWIEKDNSSDSKRIVQTPNILSPDEYRRFWIKWYGGCVCVGMDGQTSPIIHENWKMPNLKFITFSVVDQNRNPVHWRFHVPPFLEKPISKPIFGGDLHWVQVDSERRFPDDAFIGGFEKENLYVIRAKHRGSLTPGKFVSSEGLGYVSWGGDAHEKDSFEVLCGFDCKWVPSRADIIPVGAVIGGYSENIYRETLYIGRVKYMGNIIPGKVQPSHKTCYISYDGKEIGQDFYEILVVPKQTHAANKILVPFNITHSDNSDMEEEEDDDDEYYEHNEHIDYGQEIDIIP